MPVCFWTDLVNVEQSACGGGGGGGEGTLAYATESPGNCGGSLGRFSLSDSGNMSEAMGAAFAIATEIVITGVYQDSIPQDEFVNSIGDPVAEYVVFDDVDYPMTYDAGFYNAWITDEVAGLDATFGQWFRIDVDGTIFYGATPLTTNC